MTISASKALQYESEFLSAVGTNLEGAKGTLLRGSTWQQSRHDEGDRLRVLMAESGNYDRQLLKSIPSNRRVVLHGSVRRLLFWKRRTGVAIASFLSPLAHYAQSSPGDAPPIGLGELSDHVHQLVAEQNVPHIIGVCSPTGFTDEARGASLSTGGVTVVLVEPNEQGGWRTTATGDDVDPRLLKIFDPEGAKQKVDRVRSTIEARSADLLTGGLSVSSVARECGLEEHVVRDGFRQVADADPELRATEQKGEFLLYRGAPVQRQEKHSMNVIDRIRQLFSGEGDNAEKINVLAERRASLAQRRDRIYEDIGKLENKEAGLLEQGKAAKSQVPRRRLAAQMAQLRKDIARQNTTAAMLNKQINIISTDIHNLTLIQQGEAAQLPDTTALTEHAVAAEEMLETLAADADLVGQLETGMEQAMTSDEELAILREFEEADQAAAAPEGAPPVPPEPAQRARPESVVPEPPVADADADPFEADEGEKKARPTDPEAT